MSFRTGFLGRCGHVFGVLDTTFGLGPLPEVEYVFGGITPRAAQALAGPRPRGSRNNDPEIHRRKKKPECDDEAAE